jgi:hypothetical protein
MLKAKAEIMFTLENKNYLNNSKLQPVFNFGKDLLFSGTIKSDDKEYLYRKKYEVDIDFFTIYGEAYDAVKPALKPDMGLTIQAGKRILGIAKLIDYKYE